MALCKLLELSLYNLLFQDFLLHSLQLNVDHFIMPCKIILFCNKMLPIVMHTLQVILFSTHKLWLNGEVLKNCWKYKCKSLQMQKAKLTKIIFNEDIRQQSVPKEI